jgi:hypothetical protein
MLVVIAVVIARALFELLYNDTEANQQIEKEEYLYAFPFLNQALFVEARRAIMVMNKKKGKD